MLFWINFLLFQWLCLRVGVDTEDGSVFLMGFVAPLSGWIFTKHDPLCHLPYSEAYLPRPPRKLWRLA